MGFGGVLGVGAHVVVEQHGAVYGHGLAATLEVIYILGHALSIGVGGSDGYVLASGGQTSHRCVYLAVGRQSLGHIVGYMQPVVFLIERERIGQRQLLYGRLRVHSLFGYESAGGERLVFARAVDFHCLDYILTAFHIDIKLRYRDRILVAVGRDLDADYLLVCRSGPDIVRVGLYSLDSCYLHGVGAVFADSGCEALARASAIAVGVKHHGKGSGCIAGTQRAAGALTAGAVCHFPEYSAAGFLRLLS